jgi:flavin-binding protein dodecin
MSSLTEKDIEATGSSQDGSQHDPDIGISEAEDKVAPTIKAEVDEESEYITGIKLYLIILGLCMAVFLIGLVCRCLHEVLRIKS